MKIPYVIDNQKYKLSDILNAILENHQGQSMDVVTGCYAHPRGMVRGHGVSP